jgi:uncharacterized repeat protein (TIGR01451 family)
VFPVITTVTPVADVGIGKSGPASVLAASNVVYTISVTNFGPSSASGVVVTDSLPATVTFVSDRRRLEQQRYRELDLGHLDQWSDQQCHRDGDGAGHWFTHQHRHGEHPHR